jgi:hypothetical protein
MPTLTTAFPFFFVIAFSTRSLVENQYKRIRLTFRLS